MTLSSIPFRLTMEHCGKSMARVADTLALGMAAFGIDSVYGKLRQQAVEATARREEHEVRAKLRAELERGPRVEVDYTAIEMRVVQYMLARPQLFCDDVRKVLDVEALTDEQIDALGQAYKLRTSGVSASLVVWLAGADARAWA